MDNVKWLFFDVGSTLVSEEKPLTHRIHEIAKAVNEPYEVLQDKVLQLYKEKKKGERVLIQAYGMENHAGTEKKRNYIRNHICAWNN